MSRATAAAAAAFLLHRVTPSMCVFLIRKSLVLRNVVGVDWETLDVAETSSTLVSSSFRLTTSERHVILSRFSSTRTGVRLINLLIAFNLENNNINS